MCVRCTHAHVHVHVHLHVHVLRPLRFFSRAPPPVHAATCRHTPSDPRHASDGSRKPLADDESGRGRKGPRKTRATMIAAKSMLVGAAERYRSRVMLGLITTIVVSASVLVPLKVFSITYYNVRCEPFRSTITHKCTALVLLG